MEPRIARRAVAATLIAGVVADALFDRTSLGVNVPLATAGVLALVTWFGPGRRPAERLDLWLPALALVAALGPAIRTDPTVVLLDLWLLAAAVSAWAFAVSGIAVTRRSATAVAALGAHAGAAVVIGLAWLVRRAGADGSLASSTRKLGRLAPALRGAAIAVPVVIGFSLLLGSADAVFGRALDDALRLPFDLDELLRRGAFSIVAAALVAGPIALAAGAGSAVGSLGGGRAEPPGNLGPSAASAAVAPTRRSGATETLVVLVAVDALFALFAVVQVVFLFGGADTLAAVGMTYSDYARQGYFQLVGVVALAGMLLLGAHEIVGRTRAFLIAALALLGLTALILASAALRLHLYQGAYGWTELRFFVAASIAWLGACVVLAIVLLVRDRMRWLPHGLAMGAAAVTLAVSAIGPQAFVVNQNLARVLDPSLVAPGGHTGFDIDYGMTLGDDAVPALVAALDVVPAPDRATLLDLLLVRRMDLRLEVATDGPLSWNLARARAVEALAHLPDR